MIPTNPTEFNAYLSGLCRANGASKLPLDQAVPVFVQCKKLMLAVSTESLDYALLVKNLLSLVFFLPQSQEFNTLFEDPGFLKRLFRYLMAHPMDHAPFIIVTTYLRGEFLAERTQPTVHSNVFVPFLDVLVQNRGFTTSLLTRLELQDEQTTAAVVVQFLLSLYPILSWPENRNHCMIILCHFRVIDLPRIFRVSLFAKKVLPLATFGQTLKMLVYYLNLIFDLWDDPVSKQTSAIETYAEDCIDFARKVVSHEDLNSIFKSLGLDKNPKEDLLKKFSTYAIMLIKTFEKQPATVEFKREADRQIGLEGLVVHRYPLVTFVFAIAEIIGNKFFHPLNPNYQAIGRFRMYIDEVYALLLHKSLDYWIQSRACNDSPEDIAFIMNLLKIDLQFLNHNLKEMDHFDTLYSRLKTDLSYDKIREVQLKFLRDDQYLDYLDNNEFEDYSKLLKASVRLFVLNERTLEITKGTVCYLKNPVEMRDAASRDAVRCFLSILPKKNALIYVHLAPGFDVELAEQAELHALLESKHAKLVSIQSVKRVQAEQYNYGRAVAFEKGLGVSTEAIKLLVHGNSQKNSTPRNQSFTSFKKVATKILLYDRLGNVCFSFFTDTSRTATIWTDMLNYMIDASYNKFSAETKMHIRELFDIKRSLQLLPLAKIYNNRILDLYTSLTGDSKEDVGNFLQIKHLSFDFVHAETLSHAKAVLMVVRDRLRKDVIKEEEPLAPKEEEFTYTYDELLDIAGNFYYS